MLNKETMEIENVFIPPRDLIEQIGRAHEEKNPIKRLLILLGQK